MMLGTMKLEGTMYRGAEPTLEGQLSAELLKSCNRSSARGRLHPKGRSAWATPCPARCRCAHRYQGRRLRRAGWRTRHPQRQQLRVLRHFGSAAARIRGMMAVRDAVRLVFRTQLEDAPEERIIEARTLLNNIYDSFVTRYGASLPAIIAGPFRQTPISPSSCR